MVPFLPKQRTAPIFHLVRVDTGALGRLFAYAQLGAILATLVRLLQWEQVDLKAAIPETDYSVSSISTIVTHLVVFTNTLLSMHALPLLSVEMLTHAMFI